MKRLGLTAAALLMTAAAPPPPGRLPDTVKPTAYRLDLTVDPAKTSFTGHTEIDAVLARPASAIFMHGLGLRVGKATLTAGGVVIAATYHEVDPSGVARLDLPRTIPAGRITLKFDYAADFRPGPEGLFHAKVGSDWYAWTQMEPIDARRMFPGFDEPGFKTPFTVTVTAPAKVKAFANAPETGVTPVGAMTVHRFATTRPLPTYLVAIGVGPFDVASRTVPANSVRKTPLQFRVIATKGQLPRMQIAADEAPKLLAIEEKYFGIAYPFEKLDYLASPIQGGAMENAGLIIFQDTLILLDKNAPSTQLRSFGEVAAHEMAHQWFGDLVTPTWWTDIWLNESFAEWMGKKASNSWRPDLDIAATTLSDAFEAMDTDALSHGRPIHQTIDRNEQIGTAFDGITYQKGAQVVSMFESYVGPETFQKGVRAHLKRFSYVNASAEDFFGSVGTAAGNPKLVPALRTFTDQIGVPVVAVEDAPNGIRLSQARYHPLGVAASPAQRWTIPMCLSRGEGKACTLLDSTATTLPPIIGTTAALLPNADGAGYYRFSPGDAGWDRLIAATPTLPARDAMAIADSLWADFAAGKTSFDRVVAGATALAANPERLAAVALGGQLRGLASTSLTEAELPQYRRLMATIYGPRLAALGFDPRRDAYKAEPEARQALRQSLLPMVAQEARDPAVRAKLLAAAEGYLAGDDAAIDLAYRTSAFRVLVEEKGTPALQELTARLARSQDPLLRGQLTVGIGSAEGGEPVAQALKLTNAPGVQIQERMRILGGLTENPASREATVAFVTANLDKVIAELPAFARPRVIAMFDSYCTAAAGERARALFEPRYEALGGGKLELEQTRERITVCAALSQAKGAEIAASLARY